MCNSRDRPVVELFEGDTIVEGVDGDVAVQMRRSLVNQGDDSGVELMLDRKHSGLRAVALHQPRGDRR